MGDFLSELLSSLLGGLLPHRIGTLLVSVLLVLCGLAFAGSSGVLLFEVLGGSARPVLALPAVVLVGLAWLCFRLARKGFRTAKAPEPQR
jgi:hypothetical protein